LAIVLNFEPITSSSKETSSAEQLGTHAVVDENDDANNMQDVQVLPSTRKWTRGHPQNQIIGDPSDSVKTRKAIENETLYAGFLSEIEPKKTYEALDDPDWVHAMQKELVEFDRNEVWKTCATAVGKVHRWHEMGLSQQKG